MFQELRADYKDGVTKYHLVIKNRNSEVQKDSNDNTEVIASPVASSGDEGVSAPSTVEGQIREIAKQKNFEDADLLVDIAMCESSLNPQATNDHSSATGLFQILDIHGLTVEERMDVAVSTEWTIDKIESGGLSAWNASRHCWSA